MADNLRKYTTQEVLNKVYTDSSGITIGLNSQSSKETLNAVLDSSNNNADCDWDGGDCCPCTCEDATYECATYGGDCDECAAQGDAAVTCPDECGDVGFVKKRYRKFNIKIQKNKQDDYGMMKEVLNRRFKRAVQEKGNYLSFPDLVLIDGGKGQYSVARETLNELSLYDIPIIAIAKGKFRNSGDETFFHNGKKYKFLKNDPSLFFLQRLRDEAHRFAISTHRAKRKKSISRSLLEQIQGVGSNRKRALLNHFGSARAVESASLDEIKSVEGVEEKVAKKIYNFFHE